MAVCGIFELTLLAATGNRNTLFQKIKQPQRADKGIRAPVRKNPRVRAIADWCVRRMVFQTPRAQERKFSIQRDGNFSAL
jgi:hypothetical protein